MQTKEHASYDFDGFLEEDARAYRDILESLPFDPELNRFFLEQKKTVRMQMSDYHRHTAHKIPERYLSWILLEDSAEETFFKKEQQKELDRALSSLSAPVRERIYRHYLDGLTFREIAAEEGISAAGVHQSILRGLNHLRNLLKGTQRPQVSVPVLDTALRFRYSNGRTASCPFTTGKKETYGRSGMEEHAAQITVDTPLGRITGLKTDRCLKFLGIPFARAGRFEYAMPVEPWEDTLSATLPGPACPQNRAVHEHLENPTRLFYKKEFREGIDFSYDENCLNLNIYAPQKKGTYPVIVFFYGGGFDSGMNTEGPFDGSSFAENGIITVFANYRVGPLGYLCHPDIQSKYGRNGNFGLDDQLTAIRWVRDNIASFGGDPDNITLLGQSAGAISIQYLCLNPKNAGLFRRAAMLSGAGLFPKFALPKNASDTYSYWAQFMETAGCKTLDDLKRLDLDRLFDTVEAMKAARKDNLYYNMPVVDGYLLPAPVDALIRSPLPIDYLIGYTNADMYAPIMAYIGNRFGRKTDAYLYFFDIDAPGDDNRAFHSSDLRYVFGTLAGSWRPYSARDYAVSGQLNRYLANFARTGDPNGEGLPLWKKAGKGLRTDVLRFRAGSTEMGHAQYGKLLSNFLTKGDPKA